MILTPLGHTEFLVDIANPEGENVRVLIDSWFSDFIVGDLMERNVKVGLDISKLASLDAIYISHAHTDHFDPYTLSLIYQHASPLLILPFTLRYLEGLIIEFLPSAQIHWLKNRETFTLRGIEITGYMFENPSITNEDDVMMIAFSNNHELLFAEIDTVPDEEDEEVQKSLYKIFTRREYTTACYIASRNHLEGQIPFYDTLPKKRRGFRDQYIGEQKEDISMSYEKYDYEEYANFPNLFTLPGFVRGYIGQGLQYPSSLSDSLSKMVLFPLEEIASLESDIAKNHGYEFPQKALLPGRQYRIEGGNIETGRKECPIGTLELIRDHSNLEDTEERIYAAGPLFPRDFSLYDIESAKKDILDILNSRFLPYWSGSPVASLRSALIKNPDGAFRIELKVKNNEKIIFEYIPTFSYFREVPYKEKMHIDEDYWLADILDFLDGRQELYSSFWHKLDSKKVYRLWVCLGAVWMNHDLIEKKYRLHFERAKKGETAKSFVQDILTNL